MSGKKLPNWLLHQDMSMYVCRDTILGVYVRYVCRLYKIAENEKGACSYAFLHFLADYMFTC